MNISKQYIAGFFDGEGSIGLYNRTDKPETYFLRVQLTQNTSPMALLILNYLKDKYGGNISEQKTLSGGIKLNWQLNVGGLTKFLKDILPYIIIKKEQVVKSLYWIKKRPVRIRKDNGQYKPYPARFVKLSCDYARILKNLKRSKQ